MNEATVILILILFCAFLIIGFVRHILITDRKARMDKINDIKEKEINIDKAIDDSDLQSLIDKSNARKQ